MSRTAVSVFRILSLGAAVLLIPACTPIEQENPSSWPGTEKVVEPALFLPGLISTGEAERDASFYPDGNEFYFSIEAPGHSHAVIAVSRKIADSWSEPGIVTFSGRYADIEPFCSPDGKFLYFASRRPLTPDDSSDDWNLWRSTRSGSGWATPEPLGESINTEGDEFFPSVSSAGNLYFTATRDSGVGREDIWTASATENGFTEASVLGTGVNSASWEFNAWVSPAEDLLLYTAYGRDDGFGSGDLYASRRDSNGVWQEGINLGMMVNGPGLDYCPSLTADGQFLFFTSIRNSFENGFERATDLAFYRKLLEAPANGREDIFYISVEALPLLSQSD